MNERESSDVTERPTPMWTLTDWDRQDMQIKYMLYCVWKFYV